MLLAGFLSQLPHSSLSSAVKAGLWLQEDIESAVESKCARDEGTLAKQADVLVVPLMRIFFPDSDMSSST